MIILTISLIIYSLSSSAFILSVYLRGNQWISPIIELPIPGKLVVVKLKLNGCKKPSVFSDGEFLKLEDNNMPLRSEHNSNEDIYSIIEVRDIKEWKYLKDA